MEKSHSVNNLMR